MIIYQSLIMPDNTVIKKQCSRSILDSRKKLPFLRLPNDLRGKSVLDIGCAEGFFLREAYKRGAKRVKGIETDKKRVEHNREMNKLWDYDIEVKQGSFESLKEKFDIVLCLSVIHHYQKDFDTTRMLLSKTKDEVANHLNFVNKIANLTKELTIFEYAYNWKESTRKRTDFTKLAKLWKKQTTFKDVRFLGLSQKSNVKDRAIYHCFK